MRTFDTVSRDDDRIAGYSSRGPSWYDGYAKPDIMAPGHKMVSMADAGSYLYLNYAGNRVEANGLHYLSLSGTSMASPHAAGCAALLIEAGDATTPDEIETRLKTSGVQVTDPKNDLTFPRIDCVPDQNQPPELTVDADALVVDYPALWRRV